MFQQYTTEVLRVDTNAIDPNVIARAAEILRDGGLLAFPTETVYGLGANALNAEAVAGIFAAKGRPANNPLIVHVPDAEAAKQVVAEWPEAADKLAARFWPGPLTLVLPKRDSVPDIVTAGGATVAVRVPAHPVAQALLRAAGVPIAAPSANRSEQLSPTRAEHVLKSLGGRIPLILDGGQTAGGLESTVLNLSSDTPTLLRPGLISPAEIEAIIGSITRPGTEKHSAESAPLASPGLMARHYAPRAPLQLVEGDGWTRVQRLLRQGEKVGWLTFLTDPTPPNPNLIVVTMPPDAAGFAARLYAELHALDAAGVTQIIVTALPEAEDWLAVRDRLRRAATREKASEDERP